MNEENDLAIGDKVEVISSGSQYFGKTGKVIKCVRQPVEMTDFDGKPTSSGILTLYDVKLDSGTTEDFLASQLRKIQ